MQDETCPETSTGTNVEHTSPPVPLPAVKSPPWHMKSAPCNYVNQRSVPHEGMARYKSTSRTIDDTVERAALEVQGLSHLAHTLLAC